jgi:hypothetical protein
MTSRLLRFLIPALALAAAAAPSASAQGPLAGTGENIQPIASLALGDGQQTNEIELAGDHAFISGDYGVKIVNISDPAHPWVEGTWACEAGWGDIDLSPDATLAVVTNAHGGECILESGTTAVALIDISDVKHPTLLSAIPLDGDFTDPNAEQAYVHTATLDGNRVFLNPQTFAGYPQFHWHIPVWDITNRSQPKKMTAIEFPGPAVAHDSVVDHRPDGKTLLYSASIHTSDVFDISDVMKPTRLQTTTSPEMTISHDVQPNYKRDTLIVVDESAVDNGSAVCTHSGGPGPAAADVGSIHFYAAAPDGTFANGGAVELGAWNPDPVVADATCTAHVYWTAPDENRLTQAWYTQGAHILDFSDPAAPKELGGFIPADNAAYWSAKPHRGYIFATAMGRGLDVMRYTGEAGMKWPATAGPAEIQRSSRQGMAYKPLSVAAAGGPAAPLPSAGPVDTRSIGRIAFSAKLKKLKGKKGKKVTLRIAFTDAAGKVVATAKFKKAAGKKATVKVFGGAVAGTYTWTIKAGKKTLKRGKLTVTAFKGATLAPSTSLSIGAK